MKKNVAAAVSHSSGTPGEYMSDTKNVLSTAEYLTCPTRENNEQRERAHDGPQRALTHRSASSKSGPLKRLFMPSCDSCRANQREGAHALRQGHVAEAYTPPTLLGRSASSGATWLAAAVQERGLSAALALEGVRERTGTTWG